MMSDYKRLSDVNLVDFGIDCGIEDKIENLVRALLFIRFPFESEISKASCKGHLDVKKHQHPWVRLVMNLEDRGVLNCLVEDYNKKGDIKWRVHGDQTLSPVVEACTFCNINKRKMYKGELEKMQQSADELAEHIFDNRYATARTFYLEKARRSLIFFRENYGKDEIKYALATLEKVCAPIS